MCLCILSLSGASFPLHLGYRARSAPSAKRKICIPIEDKKHETNFDHLLIRYVRAMLPADGTDVSVGVLFDGHLHGGVGQEFLDEFWPLDETEGAAV